MRRREKTEDQYLPLCCCVSNFGRSELDDEHKEYFHCLNQLFYIYRRPAFDTIFS